MLVDEIIAHILIFTGWLLSVIKSAQLYFYGSRLVKCFTTAKFSLLNATALPRPAFCKIITKI